MEVKNETGDDNLGSEPSSLDPTTTQKFTDLGESRTTDLGHISSALEKNTLGSLLLKKRWSEMTEQEFLAVILCAYDCGAIKGRDARHEKEYREGHGRGYMEGLERGIALGREELQQELQVKGFSGGEIQTTTLDNNKAPKEKLFNSADAKNHDNNETSKIETPNTKNNKKVRSKGEQSIKKYLNTKEIGHIEEHTFPDCVHKRRLRFDFYLPSYNACIEYDGKQHFEAVAIFGGVEALHKTQIRDNIKTEYCLKKGIWLLRIAYNENIEKKLDEFLLKLTEQS